MIPQRIVSLVPSQTELLFDLGVGARVVGVTKFCIHPAPARSQAVVVGGTKNFDLAKIAALKPDLIIGNKEENYREGIELLAADFPVWVSDVSNLPQALDMIATVGELVGADEKAAALISLPLKYMHTTVETVHRDDVESVTRLIYETLLKIEDGHDFRYFS